MSTQPAFALDLEWTFGDKVRKIRRASGDSQQEMASKIGQTQTNIAAWETGRNENPRGIVAIAKRIELAYGVPAAWTLGLTDTAQPHPGGPDGAGTGWYTARDLNPEPAGIASVLASGTLGGVLQPALVAA